MTGMDFRHELRYDATAAEVFAMLADPAFRRRSAEAMGVVSADVSITPAAIGEGMHVTIDQVQPTEGVPGFAKRFAGETTRVIQVEEWTSGRQATISIDTPGKPTSIAGTLDLQERDGVTTETMQAVIKVKVPLIGGKLEKLMADLVAAGIEKEHAVGTAWLRGER